MVECIRVDKATLTKVIKKLEEIDYVKIVKSENDKRIKQLYLMDKAVFAARRIKKIHSSFYDTLCFDIPLSDIQQTEQTMERLCCC